MRLFSLLLIFLLVGVAQAENMSSFADRHIGDKANVTAGNAYYEGTITSSGDNLVLDDYLIISWRIIDMIVLEENA